MTRPRARQPTFGEEQFWIFESLHPREPVVNVAVAYEVRRQISISSLRRAFEAVIERHEILRTSYRFDGIALSAEVLDIVEAQVTSVFAVSAADAVETARKLAQEPFDLAVAPLFRLSLISWSADAHVLLVTCHHIVVDGPGIAILSRELGEAINAFESGLSWCPPVLKTTFSNLAAAEILTTESNGWAPGLDFWRRSLEGAPRSTPLFVDDNLRFKAISRATVCGPEKSALIRKVAQERHVSVTMIALTAWAKTLSRLGAGDDLVIGVPIAGRDTASKVGVVGLLLNTIPLRIPPLDEDPVLSLRTVRECFLRGLQWRNVPFTLLAREIRPEQSLEKDPLYRFMFTQGHEARLGNDSESASRVDLGLDFTETPLSMVLVERSDGTISTGFDVASHLFDDAFAEHLVMTFNEALGEILRAAA